MKFLKVSIFKYNTQDFKINLESDRFIKKMLEFLLIGNLMVGHSHYHISTEEFNSHLII